MTILADNYEYVIGGDPDRDTIDLVVVEAATGAVRGGLDPSPGSSRLGAGGDRKLRGRSR